MNKNISPFTKKGIFVILVSLFLGCAVQNALAQTDIYVPLIGLTSVPYPLALPIEGGAVTYHYAIKNFIKEFALTHIQVTDYECTPVAFVTGDDNNNSELDFNETWRYGCTTKVSKTTESIATVKGTYRNIIAIHTAYTTVVVGSTNPPPLVSIVNITKVAYPLSLPATGGPITFTYRVSNPGIVPLSTVSVVDNKCMAMSNKLGDTNGNNLLDIDEVWLYTCTTSLKETTTNTARVTAFANGLRAIDDVALTVKVATIVPIFPETGFNPNLKITLWIILSVLLIILTIFFFLTRGKNENKK